ncbi:transposase, IS605 OrfB family [Pyrobaculum islandicum DSM 4184]|uniref:Transposase, IS605 OrfB family n=1 Tax=Pyrobaculum islandicum (strain DSM 4184 / JCM 9189 / GEO3) TaxID=384616 RepID=A1RUK4_PYRIL|nr:zinc ribbon domain-containing protein [Pyrobaculum islandicum]ABL88636.1 transposase, IS605 OrfB family [Pyrobaculum islandicum DSM 4184]
MRTLKFKLKVVETEKLDYLYAEFNRLVRIHLNTIRQSRLYLNPNKNVLHKLTYHWVRSLTDLHSNYVTAARDLALEMVKASAKHRVFPQPGEVPVRLFRNKTYKIEGRRVQIVTRPSEYVVAELLGAEEWFSQWDKAEGALLIRRDGEWYLHVAVEDGAEPAGEPKYYVGIDFGIDRVAVAVVDRERHIVESKLFPLNVSGLRLYLRNARREMQRRGRSFRRERAVLKLLLEETTRALADYIAQFAPAEVRIEYLKGLRRRMLREYGGDWRYVASTAFYRSLYRRLAEKLSRYGIRLVEVSPKDTSTVCHICGKRGIRDGRLFHCLHCNLTTDADINAAINIARRDPALKGEVSSPNNRDWL